MFVSPPLNRIKMLVAGLAGLALLPQIAGGQLVELGEAPMPGALQSPVEATATVPALQVSTASRIESRIFHSAIYSASEGAPISWTGDVNAGDAGTTSDRFKEAVRLRVNYFRAYAGVPAAVTFSDIFNAKAQLAALMMSANGALSHSPPTTWRFYTAAGADGAGNSNLALGSFGTVAMDGYIEDSGSNNAPVGHRRWILYPQTKVMGTGDIPVDGAFNSANALWVFDSNVFGPRPATRNEFVAWPPPGFIPSSQIYARWSFSFAGANFSTTTVRVMRGSTLLSTVVESRGSGAGENTIVFVPDVGSPPAADVTYTVNVSGVVINGVSRNFNYSVTAFDPASRVGEPAVMAITGTLNPSLNATNSYSVAPLAFASNLQARALRRRLAGWTEGAETAIHRVTFHKSASYTGLSSVVVHSGSQAYHLAHPTFDDQSIEFKNQLLPNASATVSFRSRLRYATSSQEAQVQVSPDGGATWVTVWAQAGSGGPGESDFAARTVSLAPFAGRPVQVRFNYSVFGSAFPQTTSDVGWFIDDIRFSGCQELFSPTNLGRSNPWTFVFNPTVAGAYYLQVRPVLFGKYPAGWESGRSVVAN